MTQDQALRTGYERSRPSPFHAILDHLAEDAAFFWSLRREAARAPHYRLDDLAELDERLEARLDALRVWGASARQAAIADLLLMREPGMVFVAIMVADPDDLAAHPVLDAVRAGPEIAELASALAWMPLGQAQPVIRALLVSSRAALRLAALTACAVRRFDPGMWLVRGIGDDDPAIRSRALRAAGELGRGDLLPRLFEATGEASPACRLWAAWSAVRLGSSEALPILAPFCVGADPAARAARAVWLRGLPADAAAAWVLALADRPAHRRSAIEALGLLGDPRAVPWLIEEMQVPAQARAAAEIFTTITGADLDALGLSRSRPDGHQDGPTDDPADDDVAPAPDWPLPWPDPAAIASWWSRHGQHFAAPGRYLLGRPVEADWLQQVLRHGHQRHRAAAALDLVLGRSDAPLFEVRMRAREQQRRLGLPRTH